MPTPEPQTSNPATLRQELAIVGLLLNIIILPGLGTVIWGNRTHGIWQLVLAVVGLIGLLFLVGIIPLLAAWIWGIVSGVQMIKQSS